MLDYTKLSYIIAKNENVINPLFNKYLAESLIQKFEFQDSTFKLQIAKNFSYGLPFSGKQKGICWEANKRILSFATEWKTTQHMRVLPYTGPSSFGKS